MMKPLLEKIASFVDPRNDQFLGFSRAEFLRKLEDTQIKNTDTQGFV